MNDRESSPSLSDNPWFWVYLFGAAALVGLFLLGDKFDRRQAQLDANFNRRMSVLERRAAGETVDGATIEDAAHEAKPARYVSFTPFYAVFGVITAAAWIVLARRRALRKAAANRV